MSKKRKPREVKTISCKISKKRQYEVKQNKFLFDEEKHKNSRTSPDTNQKFSLTKQKT